jgi:hypothetical protein
MISRGVVGLTLKAIVVRTASSDGQMWMVHANMNALCADHWLLG